MGFCMQGGLRRMACRLLSIYGPPFIPSMGFRIFPNHAPNSLAGLLRSLPLALSRPAMAFVHLKSFRHYQPPHATGRPIKGRSVVLNRSASQVSHKHNDTIAIAPNIGSSSKLEHFDLVERVNLTDSLPMEAINLFSEPALDYGCTKVLHSRGWIHPPWFR